MNIFTVNRRKRYHGEVLVDVVLIDTVDNYKIALTRISPLGIARDAVPLIMVHGNYSNRFFWLSKKGIGIAKYLHDSGYDVWIPELRGHGLSPKPKNYSSITAEQQIRYDLPAIQDYIYKETSRKAFWVCHSFGGVQLCASLSAQWLDPALIQGVSLLGCQITGGYAFLKIPPLAFLFKTAVKLLGYIPSSKLGLGPEPEAAGTFIEIIKWKSLFGKWKDSDGFNYFEGFENISMPCLIFSGAADRDNPPKGCELFYEKIVSEDKKYIVLGVEHGFNVNYGHAEMVVSKNAQQEVWPLILNWMNALKKNTRVAC